MELMEESLENHLKNKRIAVTAEEYESTMIPISSMLNWLRKVFYRVILEGGLYNLCFYFSSFKDF